MRLSTHVPREGFEMGTGFNLSQADGSSSSRHYYVKRPLSSECSTWDRLKSVPIPELAVSRKDVREERLTKPW